MRKISALTNAEQGERRGVAPVEAEKPIEVPVADHIALSRPDAARPLFASWSRG